MDVLQLINQGHLKCLSELEPNASNWYLYGKTKTQT